ncbi:hypothetical protein O413_02754, partial [Staphylococcus aureus M0275]
MSYFEMLMVVLTIMSLVLISNQNSECIVYIIGVTIIYIRKIKV